MTMEVQINKSPLAKAAGQTAVPPAEAVSLEQFSLILDQEVSRTQEKTAAADKPSENPQKIPEKQVKAVSQKNAARIFDSPRKFAAAGQPLRSAEKIKEHTPEPPEKDTHDKDPEPKTISGGLIQTQIQQVVEKNNFPNMPLEKISWPAAKPLPQTTASAVPNFAEIYAQVMQALRAHKDGQVIKLKFALEPADLGKIDIYIFADKKDLRLAFAAGEETRRILETARTELKDLLEGFGYSLANLDFSGYSGAGHRELEKQFLAQNTEKTDYGVLKIIGKKDIISDIKYLLRDILVNYLA